MALSGRPAIRETDWIRRYIAPLARSAEADDLRDDAAFAELNGLHALSTDMLVEGRHFRPEDPLDTVGQKLVRVTVSDLIAKGALPSRVLLSIAWPDHRPEAAFAALMAGIGTDLAQFHIALIGGDTVGTDGPLCLNLIGIGTAAGRQLVRRSGAVAGHWVVVSGTIGAGGLGLAAAQAGRSDSFAAHYRVPALAPLSAARLVSDHASASLDVSDGLLIDAARLAEVSGVGLEIDLAAVPLARPGDLVEDILAQCTAGDDYQILMCIPPGTDLPGFRRIGRVVPGAGLTLHHRGQSVPLPQRLGFEHRT